MMLIMALAAHNYGKRPLFIGFEMSNDEQAARYDALIGEFGDGRPGASSLAAPVGAPSVAAVCAAASAERAARPRLVEDERGLGASDALHVRWSGHGRDLSHGDGVAPPPPGDIFFGG
jgi:hypothetical protein